MVGYSRLMESDSPRAVRLVTELRDRWLEPKATAMGGEVLKRMGDGFLIAFGSTQDAVEAAMAVQKDLSRHPDIALRIAVHLGEMVDDGTDVYGAGINVVSRLQVEVPPGGVLVSQDLHRLLEPETARAFSDAGSFTLKNIAQPVTAFVWRMERAVKPQVDEVPVIAVEPIAAPQDQPSLREAAGELAEQLTHRLSRRTGVRVRSAAAEDEAASPATYLLRGSLRPRGGGVRLTLTFLRRSDGSVIWSDQHEGPQDDAETLCDRAAAKADSDLRLVINAFDGDRVADLPVDALSASELRTRAAQMIYRCTTEAMLHARTLIDRALTLDPENGMSLAMWVEIMMNLVMSGGAAGDAETLRLMATRADAAVQAMPRSDYVFYVRAMVRARILANPEGASQDIARIDRINPGYPITFEAKGMTAMAQGDFSSAATSFRNRIEATDREPYLPLAHYQLSAALLKAGRPAEAVQAIREALDLHADCRAYWQHLAAALTAMGESGAAAEAARTAATMPDRPDPQAQRMLLD